MRSKDPSSRVEGGARACAKVEAMEAVDEVTLWKALGIARCRVCVRGFVAGRDAGVVGVG